MAAGIIHLPVAAAAAHLATPPAAPAALAVAGLEHDLGVLLITSLIPLALVLATEVLKDRNKLSSVQSRKFLHISTGPLFVLTWPLYSSSSGARCLAAMLPALMSLRFLLAGLGITREPRLVAGTARSGQRQELLRGPLLYGCSHVALTLVFWRENPAAVLGIAALCAGDGLADIFGRRWGRTVLPHNKAKTWVGSAACVAGSFAVSILLLLYFEWRGLILQQTGLLVLLQGCCVASLAAAAVESLPLLEGADNVLVPAAAAAVGLCWFGLA